MTDTTSAIHPQPKAASRAIIYFFGIFLILVIFSFIQDMRQTNPSINNNGAISFSKGKNVSLTKNIIKSNEIGSLYWCGYKRNLSISLFPEFANHSFAKYVVKNQATANDILAYGMHGPCGLHPLTFPGKILFLDGESFGNGVYSKIPGTEESTLHGFEDVYQLGMLPETPHSLVVYHAAIVFTEMYPGQINKFANLESKSKNNGQHNALIYVHRHCVDYRQEAFKRISEFMTVHYGGQCKGSAGTNSTHSPEMTPEIRSHFDLPTVYAKYKFCLSMENRMVRGYVTEKIITAFLGGCIPIYYGTDDIFDIFNPKAFVYYDVKNPEPALATIQYLMNNEDAYMDMLNNQPILANGNDSVREYFSLSDEIGNGYLKHRIRVMMGIDNDNNDE